MSLLFLQIALGKVKMDIFILKSCTYFLVHCFHAYLPKTFLTIIMYKYYMNCLLYREHAPSIIFMDEIDSIGSARMESGSGNGDSEVQRTMLELLNQLDGFEASNKIKVTELYCYSALRGI